MIKLVKPLINVYRGELLESIHYGHISVVKADGQVLKSWGDNMITYWRSAAKPFQAMAVILSGAAEEFGLTRQELAVISASHNGEDEHQGVIRSILDKLELSESNLLCGIHPPVHKPTAQLLSSKGEKPGPIHNNCSGKHAGLLAVCKQFGWSFDDYNNPKHPLQQYILNIIEEVTDYPANRIYKGIDGCGVVVFGLPLEKMAYAYARLSNPEYLPDKYQNAAWIITESMEEYPQMVAGTDRFNTDLLKTTANKLVAKSGAEGVFCLGIHGNEKYPPLGIAVKIADGNSRALPPAVVELLQELDILSDTELNQLKSYHYPDVVNNHQAIVGKLEPVFSI